MRRVLFLLLLPLLVFTASSQNTNERTFEVKGVVVGLEPDGKNVRIKHEAIPGYMGAMTMPFRAKDTNELAGLVAGDPVSFRMVVTDKDGWIEQIRKSGATVAGLPTNAPYRLVREVEPLNEGDLLPAYAFTNQFGTRFSTKDFQGQALALTFLFTRCPYPTYCPLMANNFTEVQQRMAARTNGPANWHLLTISFDPAFDSPEVLKGYAEFHQYDSKRWTFATGALIDITAIGEQFGLTFWRDEQSGLPSHNLRTVVITAAGRVQKIFVGNEWTPDELVEEMVKAAAAR